MNNLLPKTRFISSGKMMIPVVSRAWGQDLQRQLCEQPRRVNSAACSASWASAKLCVQHRARLKLRVLCRSLFSSGNFPVSLCLSPPHHQNSPIPFLNIYSNSSLWFCPKQNLLYLPLRPWSSVLCCFSSSFRTLKKYSVIKIQSLQWPLNSYCFFLVVIFSQWLILLMDFMDS